MSIITVGGGIERTHGPESDDEREALAATAGDADTAQATARDLLNQPSTYTPQAAAAFATIERALATSIIDPIVSDRDTRKVIDALAPLSTREWLAVVRKMQGTPAPEGNLFTRFAKRGLADSHAGIESFMRQVLDKFGTRDQAGGVSIPSKLLAALGEEVGAPSTKELSAAGRIKKDVGDAAALAAFVVLSLARR